MEIIIGLLINLALSYILAPKPENAKPAAFGDIKAANATEGTEIPVLFGCRTIRGYNTVWYGDFSTEAIKTKGGKK